MNTANWVPDLFMKRVSENKEWTLFSPEETPDLHDLFGPAFESRYEHYEKLADEGVIKLFKRIPAITVWRKMLSMLFETGHPWITFKDPCNMRSPQQHMGVVHSSNLAHVQDGRLNLQKLQKTCRIAMRMLDNVIDINYYSVAKARNSNLRHRPVGLGFMGFQDALHALRISYSSEAAVEFADESMEAISLR
jgi:ribonucleoside-diphosphate reductase alpha chain